MTLIGAFKCMGSVVLFADRQETIADYAKWDTPKIYHWELQDEFRFLMAGAGESDPIKMIWEAVKQECKHVEFKDLKDTIIRVVHRITRKNIFPLPKDERGYPDIIWAIQPISKAARSVSWEIQLFHTYRTYVQTIDTHYFTGNPVLLARFINDQYFTRLLIGPQEAEALSVYLLWEAKEYDTYCGKYSDVFTLRLDGTIGRLTLTELEYWEEHWRQFKEGIRLLPMLSCSATFADQQYPQGDYLQRVVTTIKTLQKEQKKMRQKQLPVRNRLEERLMKNLRRTAQKYSKQSASQKLKGQQ